MNDMPMQLQRPIKTPVALVFYLTQSDTLLGSEKMKMATRGITPGGSTSFYFKEPSFDSIPKGASPGDILSGTITYLKKDNATLGCGTRPGGYDVKYIVGDIKAPSAEKEKEKEKGVMAAAATPAFAATATAAATVGTATATATAVATSTVSIMDVTTTVPITDTTEIKLPKESGMEGAVREAKTKYLKTLAGTPAFDSLYTAAELEYPADLPLKLVALSHAVKLKTAALTAEKKLSTAETTGTSILTVRTVSNCLIRVQSLAIISFLKFCYIGTRI